LSASLVTSSRRSCFQGYAWFAYGDERLGQGRENAKQFLKENYEIRERILYEVYEKLGLLEPVETADEVAEEPAGQVV
jgi:recombination protein RecA